MRCRDLCRSVAVAVLLLLLPVSTALANEGCTATEVVDPATNEVRVIYVCPDDSGGGSGPTTPPDGGGDDEGVPSGPSCVLDHFNYEELQDLDGAKYVRAYYTCTVGADTYIESRWVCYASCPGGTPDADAPPPGLPGSPWESRLDDLIVDVEEQLDLPLPDVTGTWEVGGASHPSDMAVVNAETWFWADEPDELTETGTDGPLTVVITATPLSLSVDPGDGSDVIECPSVGVAYDEELTYHEQSAQGDQPSVSDCHHVFRRTSLREDDGVFTVTATMTWDVQYTYTGPISGSGDLGPDEVSSTIEIEVGEIQSVRGR